jgi:hypothetical protein
VERQGDTRRAISNAEFKQKLDDIKKGVGTTSLFLSTNQRKVGSSTYCDKEVEIKPN